MITLNKLLPTKIKKNFFFILNEVKEFYKRKLEIKKKKKKKFKMLLFLTRVNSLLHFPMFSGGIVMQHWAGMG